jgi:hypothetical protein
LQIAFIGQMSGSAPRHSGVVHDSSVGAIPTVRSPTCSSGEIAFPTKLEDVTLTWIASAFGVDPSSITAFELTIPDQNPGYGSEIAFLRISSTADIPTCAMIKVPPLHPESAALARAAGSFRREAVFYKFLAPETPVRTPEVHAVEVDDSTGDAILVLEDCSSMATFSFIRDDPQVRLDQLQAMVKTAARLHAHWWNRSDELARFDAVMRPGHPTWTSLARFTQSALGQFLDSPWAEFAPAESIPTLRRVAQNFGRLLTDWWPTNNLTLAHMDFHVQNMFYDHDTPDDPILAFDWDGCHIAPGAHDVAYLLSLLPIDLRRRHEAELPSHYHANLKLEGVSNYGLRTSCGTTGLVVSSTRIYCRWRSASM